MTTVHSSPDPSPSFGARPYLHQPPAGSGAPVISPSRQIVRKADPSLSFQVSAPGMRSFDVIVATDPSLFDPANAHRRTARNFRSSRQDFQGEPIEIETGFYMLPRAFIRDLAMLEPRPARLYYLAVAYADAEGAAARYSVAPERMATAAPYVSLAAALATASLGKTLGIPVERLGAVSADGRVMRARSGTGPEFLPTEIGGLPLAGRAETSVRRPARRPQVRQPQNDQAQHRQPPNGAAVVTPRQPATPPAAATPNGGTAAGPQNGIVQPAPSAYPAPPPAAQPDPAATNGEVKAAVNGEENGQTPFVDEDYAYGAAGGEEPGGGFRDLDAGTPMPAFDYDDGFGAMPATFAATPETSQPEPPAKERPEPRPAQTEPIPPLDPAPDRPDSGGGEAPAPAGDDGWKFELAQRLATAGIGGRFDALNLDGAFRGRFGQGDPHYRRAHEGLRFGFYQASQDGGELGELLAAMRGAAPDAFAEIFGPAADLLIETLQAEGPSSLEMPEGRSARVQPVEGADLWEEPWV
ncbi:MAG: hypothetical protein ACR2RE_30600, partial [Geminicoccaceae bacterium]